MPPVGIPSVGIPSVGIPSVGIPEVFLVGNGTGTACTQCGVCATDGRRETRGIHWFQAGEDGGGAGAEKG